MLDTLKTAFRKLTHIKKEPARTQEEKAIRRYLEARHNDAKDFKETLEKYFSPREASTEYARRFRDLSAKLEAFLEAQTNTEDILKEPARAENI